MTTVLVSDDRRAGAEVVYGPEDCYHHSLELLEELGFPRGVLPLKNLEECGRVKETGFVWMKQKEPYEHYFKGTHSKVRYATEVTAYIGKNKMTNMTGVKSKQVLVWIPLTEMTVMAQEEDPSSNNIYFKTPMGIGKSFPFSAFECEEESVQAY